VGLTPETRATVGQCWDADRLIFVPIFECQLALGVSTRHVPIRQRRTFMYEYAQCSCNLRSSVINPNLHAFGCGSTFFPFHTQFLLPCITCRKSKILCMTPATTFVKAFRGMYRNCGFEYTLDRFHDSLDPAVSKTPRVRCFLPEGHIPTSEAPPLTCLDRKSHSLLVDGSAL